MRIRRAVEGDAETVAGMLIRLVEQHAAYDESRFSNFVTKEGAAAFYRDRMNATEAAVLVAEVEGKVVGFAYLEFEERNYEELLEKAVWLHDIFLEPDARSAGAGKALMQASVASAKELGGDKLMLSVAAKNLSAQSFFEEFGFRTTMLEMTLDIDG